MAKRIKVWKCTTSAANRYPAKEEKTTLIDNPILVTDLKSARNVDATDVVYEWFDIKVKFLYISAAKILLKSILTM